MEIGRKIIFNNDLWCVLDVKNSKALLLREKTLDMQQYHNEFVDITWKQCTLRQYLNNDFYAMFNPEEKNRIIKSKISNNKNLKYGTDSGIDTFDYIFLLSIDEILLYFGDFWQYYDEWKKDPNKNRRKAKNNIGKYTWWWLRSSGVHNRNAVYINSNGRIFVGGDSVNRLGSVRPALWIKI